MAAAINQIPVENYQASSLTRDNPRGLISPSVRRFLLSFPYALRYVFFLLTPSFYFSGVRYGSQESMRF